MPVRKYMGIIRNSPLTTKHFINVIAGHILTSYCCCYTSMPFLDIEWWMLVVSGILHSSILYIIHTWHSTGPSGVPFPPMSRPPSSSDCKPLHQRHYYQFYHSTLSHIAGTANVMADDDCSRHWHLSDAQLNTHPTSPLYSPLSSTRLGFDIFSSSNGGPSCLLSTRSHHRHPCQESPRWRQTLL
jgi:hypothetical protein